MTTARVAVCVDAMATEQAGDERDTVTMASGVVIWEGLSMKHMRDLQHLPDTRVLRVGNNLLHNLDGLVYVPHLEQVCG